MLDVISSEALFFNEIIFKLPVSVVIELHLYDACFAGVNMELLTLIRSHQLAYTTACANSKN